MQRFLMVIFLEGYAIFLAYMQGLSGVHTDEAKYLLNIPYPHPPLVRWIIGQTEWMQYQELFWRLIFATLLVQAVWVVIWMCHSEEPLYHRSCDSTIAAQRFSSLRQGYGRQANRCYGCVIGWASRRMILGVSWLLSTALWIEGGKIMMAPIAALEGLVFISLLMRQDSKGERAGFVALFWLVSLFTAYQAVLFLPVVIAVFWRMKIPAWHKLVYVGGPLVVLVLYTLTNPLVIASMINVGGQQVSVPVIDRIRGVLDLWLIGGSITVGVLGILGMVHARNIPLMTSLVLVCVYIFVAHRAYYSVLFLPLFVGGLSCLLKKDQIPMYRFAGLVLIVWIIFVGQYPFDRTPNFARQILSHVPQVLSAGDILIAGTFGHEWQYESRVSLRRYRPELLSAAQAAVCISPCAEIEWRGWKKLMDDPVEVYVPREAPLPRGARIKGRG